MNAATAYTVLFRPLASIVRAFDESYLGISVHLEGSTSVNKFIQFIYQVMWYYVLDR